MRREPSPTSSQVVSTRKQKNVRGDKKNGVRSTANTKRPTTRKLTAEEKALRDAHQRFFAEAGSAGFSWLD